jgi:hypothetical protein
MLKDALKYLKEVGEAIGIVAGYLGFGNLEDQANINARLKEIENVELPEAKRNNDTKRIRELTAEGQGLLANGVYHTNANEDTKAYIQNFGDVGARGPSRDQRQLLTQQGNASNQSRSAVNSSIPTNRIEGSLADYASYKNSLANQSFSSTTSHTETSNINVDVRTDKDSSAEVRADTAANVTTTVNGASTGVFNG